MTNDTPLANDIVSNPLRQGGRPTLAGTRITVEVILDKLAADQTVDDILADYPQLSRTQILNATTYAAELIHLAPCAEREYAQLTWVLDTLIDQAGEDETHPLASLMEIVGALIERYEDEHVPEL